MKRKPSGKVWGATWRQALTVLTIGWDLALPIFGGVLLGHYLDRWLGRGYTYTLGLLLLGLIVGVYNVARALRRELRRDQLGSTEASAELSRALTEVRARYRAREQEQEEENADHL